MAVILLRPYSGFASGALVTLDAATEAGLVAQSLAFYTSAPAINPDPPPGLTPTAAVPAGRFGPAVVTNIPIGAAALTGFETNGVAQTAFAINVTEIFVPHWNTWTGAAVLNGTTVGTDRCQDGRSRYDVAGGQCLCQACHNRKTARDNGRGWA